METRYEEWLRQNESKLVEQYPGNRIDNEGDFQEWCKEQFESQ